MMPVNNATSNFGLMHLDGSDTAGYNSINALITDIDNELYARVAVPGMIMLFQGAIGDNPSWEELSGADLTAIEGAIGVAPAGFQWIKKKA
jgi:hypothetical protein